MKKFKRSCFALGFVVLALVQLSFANHTGDAPAKFEEAIQGIPEILSCRNVTGEADYFLQIVAPDLDAYGNFLAEVLRKLMGPGFFQEERDMEE